jgi:uncharacterized protein YdeI (YjbR/CyaY-like superfamily)
MSTASELPIIPFASQESWREWLDAHHDDSPGLWLKLAKKGAGIASITYPEALDEALCYGWIDGQKRSFDESYWLQKFTPRRPRSLWSKVNCGKVEKLIEEGRMHPAGLREVERARADGRWEASYHSQSRAEVPEELQAALDANPAAGKFFATLDSTNRYAVIFRVQTARKPETRAARIERLVAMLAEKRKLHE